MKSEKNNGIQTAFILDDHGVFDQFRRGIDGGLRRKDKDFNGDHADGVRSTGQCQYEHCGDPKSDGNKRASARCDRRTFLYDRTDLDLAVQSHRKSFLRGTCRQRIAESCPRRQ